jgi:hypothetical protein
MLLAVNQSLRRVLSQQSDVVEDYATLVSSLGHLGRRDGVQAAIDKYNAITVGAGFDPLTVQEMGWWWYGDMFNYDDTYRADCKRDCVSRVFPRCVRRLDPRPILLGRAAGGP